MSAFYNKDIDSVRQEVNGSLEPLSNQQVRINQEKYKNAIAGVIGKIEESL